MKMFRAQVDLIRQHLFNLSTGKQSMTYRQMRHFNNSEICRYKFSENKFASLLAKKPSNVTSVNSMPIRCAYDLNDVENRRISTSQVALNNNKGVAGEEPTSEKIQEASEERVDEPLVLTERIAHLHIMTISMNRGKKRNCVNHEMAQQLLDAFYAYEADEEMYCAVFHGLGGNFSAGYDLEELADIDESELANTVASHMIDRGPMGPTRMEFTKPVIAAIEGWCVAGGLELALMADLRVVDADAKLGFLNRRFGVPLLDGGSVRLPELIGLSRAMDLILTGRIVDANEAHTLGLVNVISKTGAAYGRAMHLAKEITAHPQTCLRADRASAIHATFASKSLQQSLDHEGMEGLHVLSKESINGAKKFVSGLGKHGKFNVTPVAEKQEWQKEFDEMIKDNKSN